MSNDPVNHPSHYTDHPSGVECIEITEHMGFNLGNAMKYIWRCDLKKDAIEDLTKPNSNSNPNTFPIPYANPKRKHNPK